MPFISTAPAVGAPTPWRTLLPSAVPRTSRPRSWRRFLAVGVLTAVISVGCTVSSSAHYQIDWVYWGYHFHIYRAPTAQIWTIHDLPPPWGCSWNPACTLAKIRSYVDLNWFTGTYFGGDRFFDDDVDDFNEALRSTPHPWPLNLNAPWEYGCLGGYRNTGTAWNDGDWYGDGQFQ